MVYPTLLEREYAPSTFYHAPATSAIPVQRRQQDYRNKVIKLQAMWPYEITLFNKSHTDTSAVFS